MLWIIASSHQGEANFAQNELVIWGKSKTAGMGQHKRVGGTGNVQSDKYEIKGCQGSACCQPLGTRVSSCGSPSNLSPKNFSARQLPAEPNSWEAGRASLQVSNAAAFQGQLSGSWSLVCPKPTFALLLLPPSPPAAPGRGCTGRIQGCSTGKRRYQNTEFTLNGLPQCWG